MHLGISLQGSGRGIGKRRGFPRQPLQPLGKMHGEHRGRAESLFSSTGMEWKGFEPCLVREMLLREGQGCGCRYFTPGLCGGCLIIRAVLEEVEVLVALCFVPFVGWVVGGAGAGQGGGLELIEKGKDKCPGESGGQWCGRVWMMLLRCWIMTFPFSPSIILPLVSWGGIPHTLSLGVAMVRIGSIPELDEILTGLNLLSHAWAVSEHAFCTL